MIRLFRCLSLSARLGACLLSMTGLMLLANLGSFSAAAAAQAQDKTPAMATGTTPPASNNTAGIPVNTSAQGATPAAQATSNPPLSSGSAPTGPTLASSSSLVTQDLTGPLTPGDLAHQLVGAGVVTTNVTYTGAEKAAGTFSGGTGIIGFESGLILSTGDIANAIGPNDSGSKSTNLGKPGDADLSVLSGHSTHDAAKLEFDFVPNAGKIFMQYVFASEEYNEFVNSTFNDVFGFFVNGVNYAKVSGSAISINTINNGNPYGSTPNSHPELFINNDFQEGTAPLNTQMDGLTKVLTFEAPVNSNVVNHIKLSIADASDFILDAVIFLKASSFTSQPPGSPEPSPVIPPAPEPKTPAPTPAPAPEPPTVGDNRAPAPAPAVMAAPLRTTALPETGFPLALLAGMALVCLVAGGRLIRRCVQ